MERCVIIIPTHSAYKDVCDNFIELFRKNWPDCNYKIVISICGSQIEFGGGEVQLFCGENATLPYCVRKAAENNPAETYLIFLGDAFIYKKINNEEIEDFLKEIVGYGISYCNLHPSFMKSKTVSLGRYLKKINIRDRYSFSFVSFAANWKFIDDELKENVTDLEFESKYLNLAATTPDTSLYLDKAVCLKSNIFNIIPGIDKGKWNRLAYLLIKIKNKDINLCKRDKISYRWQLYLLLRKLFVIIAPDKFRQFLKKNVMNSKLFYTDN